MLLARNAAQQSVHWTASTVRGKSHADNNINSDQPVKIGTLVEMVTRKARNDEDERGMLVYRYALHPLRL